MKTQTKIITITLLLAIVPEFLPAVENMPGISFKNWLEYKNSLQKDPGLVVYYTFEEESDMVKNNSHIENHSAYDAKIANGTRVTGRWLGKKALFFDKGCAEAKTCNIKNNAFSCELWVMQKGQGSALPERGNGTLIGMGGYQCGWRLCLTTHSVLFSIGTPKANMSVQAPGLKKNTWQHIAATWDGKVMKLYIDGKLRGKTSYNGEYLPIAENTKCLRVGYDKHMGVGSFKLAFDEIAIYDRILSPEEIFRHRYIIPPSFETQQKK